MPTRCDPNRPLARRVIDRHELGAWLRLLETPLVGRESARKLLAAFGSPQAVIEAPTHARRELVGSSQATALATYPDDVAARVAATLAWLDAEATAARAAAFTPTVAR